MTLRIYLLQKEQLRLRLLAIFLIAGQWLHAQNDQYKAHHYHHEHHEHEIGIANAPVYFGREKDVAYGLHFHYVRMIKKSKLGIGVGYERIFDEHNHNTFGVVGSYRPLQGLVVNLSPGVTFEDRETSEINFAVHVETSYEFEVRHFHIGPVAEFAYDPEDYHISLGLHVGFGL